MSGPAMTVRELRERLDAMADESAVYVETIVGGDLGTDDTALVDAQVVTDRNGHYLRLIPDPADDYGTRELIDVGLVARAARGEGEPT